MSDKIKAALGDGKAAVAVANIKELMVEKGIQCPPLPLPSIPAELTPPVPVIPPVTVPGRSV